MCLQNHSKNSFVWHWMIQKSNHWKFTEAYYVTVITFSCIVFNNASMLHSLSDEIVSSESPTYLTYIIPSIPQNIYLCDKAKIVFFREYGNIVCYFCLLV